MRKTFAKILGIMISCVLISQTMTVYAVTTQKDLKNKQSQINDQIEEAKEEKKELETQKSETMKTVESLRNKIITAEDEVDDLQTRVDDLQAQITQKEKDIKSKEDEYNKQMELLDERMLKMYSTPKTGYLETFLNASSMTDFLAKYYAASELVSYDKKLMKETKEQKEQIENEKIEIENNKKELDSSLSEKEKKSNELKSLKKDKETQVANLADEEKKKEKEIEAFEEDKRQIQAQLKKIAEEEAKRNKNNTSNNITTKPSASGYIFPVRGLSKANINNKNYPSYAGHTGVDVNIGVTGKDVVAVKAGTVVISTAKINSEGNYFSYGEYVVISHGDGTMTLYGHMLANSRKVKVGDKVSQGQTIGTVGSTGNSSGTHLHFEVRINGKPVNPLPYLP